MKIRKEYMIKLNKNFTTGSHAMINKMKMLLVKKLYSMRNSIKILKNRYKNRSKRGEMEFKKMKKISMMNYFKLI